MKPLFYGQGRDWHGNIVWTSWVLPLGTEMDRVASTTLVVKSLERLAGMVEEFDTETAADARALAKEMTPLAARAKAISDRAGASLQQYEARAVRAGG